MTKAGTKGAKQRQASHVPRLRRKTGGRWGGLFAALDEFPRDFVLDRQQEQPRRVVRKYSSEKT
jgi:hypothetical protein